MCENTPTLIAKQLNPLNNEPSVFLFALASGWVKALETQSELSPQEVQMVEMSIVYQGEKHCELTHGPSGSKIETDAPRDNMGRGERFSPTDLMGAALASCVLTTMAIVAER